MSERHQSENGIKVGQLNDALTIPARFSRIRLDSGDLSMAERHREEVLNTVLATCLGRRGVEADPETIIRKGRARPDVIAVFRGLRCAIEGKIADTPRANDLVLADARSRVEQGIAHLAIAVVYPARLRTVAFSALPDELSAAGLEFAVLTEAGAAAWHKGGINDILAELRRAYDVIVRDDVLQQAVDTLNLGLSEVASALSNNKAACDRLIKVLGIGSKSNVEASV
ncbi:hypothetical protein ACVIGA_005131 [Bradyrhizobium sp. USDA 3240]